jgi:hypothetical protein
MTTRRSLAAAAAVLIVLAHPSAQPFDSFQSAPLAQSRSLESWRPTVVAQHGMSRRAIRSRRKPVCGF